MSSYLLCPHPEFPISFLLLYPNFPHENQLLLTLCSQSIYYIYMLFGINIIIVRPNKKENFFLCYIFPEVHCVWHKWIQELFSDTKKNLEKFRYKQNHSTVFYTEEKKNSGFSNEIRRSRAKEEMVMDDEGSDNIKCDPTHMTVYGKVINSWNACITRFCETLVKVGVLHSCDRGETMTERIDAVRW